MVNFLASLIGSCIGLVIVAACTWNADGVRLNGPALATEDTIIVYPEPEPLPRESHGISVGNMEE